MRIIVTCPNVPLAPHTFHHYVLQYNVCIKGGAGFSCCGCIGDSMMQQGHFTSLQLKSRKQWTKQSLQTSAMIAPEVDTVR